MSRKFGSYGFHFMDDVSAPPVQIAAVGLEQRVEDYYYDNSRRSNEGYLFQYTLEGMGSLERDGEVFDVPPGHGFLVSLPGPESYYLPPDPGPGGWQFLFIILRGDGVQPYFHRAVEQAGTLFRLSSSAPSVALLGDVFRQAHEGSITHPFHASDLGFRFLCRLAMDLQERPEPLSPRIREALRIMETEFNRLEGVAQLADRLGVTSSHLSREFYRQTGSSPIAFLVRVRLRHSILLLRDSSLSIGRVAALCGFSCANYYSKVFKKHVGVSPNAFRRDRELQSYTGITL